jgi:hypothetical protein
MITIQTRTIDERRAARMVLAILNDNEPAVRQVMDEAADDEQGPNGLVFALLDLCAGLAVVASPNGDAAQQIEQALLALDHRDGD